MTKLPYSSVAGPALALAFDNRLFLAWADRDTHRLHVMTGMEINQYSRHAVAAESTAHAPAMAAHGGRLVIAWTGEDGGGHLNVISSADGVTWIDKRTIWTDTSSAGPSLVSYQGRLYLAYTGLDSHIYVLSSGNGVDFDPNSRMRFSQTAAGAPAISARTTQNGDPQFLLAWTGGGSRINYLECEGISFGDLNASTPGFGDTSPTGPTLSSSFIDILLMYRGFGDRLYSLGAGEGTIHLDSHTVTYLDTSGFAPATARGNNFPTWVAWTGQDGDQSLNVSSLSLLRKA